MKAYKFKAQQFILIKTTKVGVCVEGLLRWKKLHILILNRKKNSL